MPRSHKPRKRYIPKRLELDTMGLAHARASRVPPGQLRQLVDPVRQSFERMRAGAGDWNTWANVADALNVAERLALLGIASDRTDEFAAGQVALAALHQRHAEGRGWTLRGPEIGALDVAIELHEVQLELCSQGELTDAISTVQRCVQQALAGNSSPKAHLCVAGGLGRASA